MAQHYFGPVRRQQMDRTSFAATIERSCRPQTWQRRYLTWRSPLWRLLLVIILPLHPAHEHLSPLCIWLPIKRVREMRVEIEVRKAADDVWDG